MCERDLSEPLSTMIRDGKFSDEWNASFVTRLGKGKGFASSGSNHGVLKLSEHDLKVVEWIIETIFLKIIEIDNIQFGLLPGRGAADAMFVVRQNQVKFIRKNCNLFLAFIDFRKDL